MSFPSGFPPRPISVSNQQQRAVLMLNASQSTPPFHTLQNPLRSGFTFAVRPVLSFNVREDTVAMESGFGPQISIRPNILSPHILQPTSISTPTVYLTSMGYPTSQP